MENIKRVNLRHEIPDHYMKIYGWLLACFCSLNLAAQDHLVITGKPNALYVLYPANGNENLQQISSRFGFSVAKLSSVNAMHVNPVKAFPKGTEIRIPVTRDILLQQPGENSAPVAHIIRKGENLYRLSLLYNKVPLASLRQWNHLKKDVVKLGQAIIVGYMVNAVMPAADTKPAETKDIITTEESHVVKPVADPAKSAVQKNTAAAFRPVKNEGTVKAGVPEKQPVVAPAAQNPVAEKMQVQQQVKEEMPAAEKKITEKPVAKDEPSAAIGSYQYAPRESDEGFYALGYTDHGKDQPRQYRSGDASSFKTISGWTDRKFYVLMNDVAPKTIVRITAPTQKSICAMVLGPLQETKGAAGLLLRISNSAVAALGMTDQKFTVAITYFE